MGPRASGRRAAYRSSNEAEGFSSQEREILGQSFPELLADTPKTEVVALRVKRLLGKASGAAGEALKKIVVDVASETAKKILTGG